MMRHRAYRWVAWGFTSGIWWGLSLGLPGWGTGWAIAQSTTPFPPSPSVSQPATKTLELSLADAITLLLQHNRDLKNAVLERIVQRQELREAESAFSVKVQPLLGIGVTRLLTSSESFTARAPGFNAISVGVPGNGATGESVSSSLNTTYSRTTQIVSQLKTPLGTQISLELDPLRPENLAVLRVSQPLLRGFGQGVNEAPLKIAQITESKNVLELEKTLSDRITETAIAYRRLAQSQEALRIQQISLTNQRRQLELVQVLVDAGRKARSELIDVTANIASSESSYLSAQNQFAQSQSDLLKLLGLSESLNLVVPAREIAALNQIEPSTLPAWKQLNEDTLLKTAYVRRPDYLQAQLDLQVTDLNLQVAQNNTDWGLDLQGNLNTGSSAQLSATLVLTRVFEDQSLETARQRQRVSQLQRQNNLVKLTETIKLEVSDRLRDVNSALNQVTATEQSRRLSESRAANAEEQFKRGQVDIFRLLELQNQAIQSQQTELNAKITFFNALTQLDQALGITLESWQAVVESSQLLDRVKP